MHVQIHYQGLESSQWINQFINGKVEKLDRYLTPASKIHVHLKFENRNYVTCIDVHSPNHNYAFRSDGDNLYESFSLAIDKAARSLGEQKRRLKDKIHNKFNSLKNIELAA